MKLANSSTFTAAEPDSWALTRYRTRFPRATDGLRPQRHQLPPCDIQIDQREQPDDLAGVLRQPTVSHLDVAELALEDAKGMLDATENLGDDPVEERLGFGLLDTGGASDRHAVERTDAFDGLMDPGVVVTAVGRDAFFLPVQQMLRLGAVGDLRRGRARGVDQSALAVGADMNLHAEMPGVAFLGLRHLRIALAFRVLGRRGRGDQGGIDQGAGLEQQPLAFEQLAHQREHLFGQFVRLEQTTEVEDRGLVGGRVLAQLEPGKPTHRLHDVERFLHARIGQREPLLQAPHPQNLWQTNRRPSALRSRLQVMRLDERLHPRPRHDRVHLRKETLAFGALLLGRVRRGGEGQLLHARRFRVGGRRYDMRVVGSLTGFSEIP